MASSGEAYYIDAWCKNKEKFIADGQADGVKVNFSFTYEGRLGGNLLIGAEENDNYISAPPMGMTRCSRTARIFHLATRTA